MMLADNVNGGELVGGLSLMAFFTVAGATGKWLWDKWKEQRALRRNDNLQDEETAISRLNALLNRYEEERKADREEVHNLRDELNAERLKRVTMQVTLTRAIAWIRMLESQLKAKNIEFTVWEDVHPSGTDVHNALEGEGL